MFLYHGQLFQFLVILSGIQNKIFLVGEDNCFTMLSFLPFNNMNQSQLYTALLSLPSCLSSHPSRVRASGWASQAIKQLLTIICFILPMLGHMSMLLSVGPTLSFPCCAKSIFYVCTSISSVNWFINTIFFLDSIYMCYYTMFFLLDFTLYNKLCITGSSTSL